MSCRIIIFRRKWPSVRLRNYCKHSSPRRGASLRLLREKEGKSKFLQRVRGLPAQTQESPCQVTPGKTRRCPSTSKEGARSSVGDGEQWKERRNFYIFLRGEIQRVKEANVDCELE